MIDIRVKPVERGKTALSKDVQRSMRALRMYMSKCCSTSGISDEIVSLASLFDQ
jgi:hypothetical protein